MSVHDCGILVVWVGRVGELVAKSVASTANGALNSAFTCQGTSYLRRGMTRCVVVGVHLNSFQVVSFACWDTDGRIASMDLL
jgi:hypothetical protein